MFWPHQPIPFVVCLGKSAQYGGPGDDVSPKDMRAFQVPVGYGVIKATCADYASEDIIASIDDTYCFVKTNEVETCRDWPPPTCNL